MHVATVLYSCILLHVWMSNSAFQPMYLIKRFSFYVAYILTTKLFTSKIFISAAFSWQPFWCPPCVKVCFLRAGAWGSSPLRCQLPSGVWWLLDIYIWSSCDYGICCPGRVWWLFPHSKWLLSREINIHARYSLSQGVLEKIMSCSLPDPKFCILGAGCWRVTSPYCSLVPQDSCFCKYGTLT